MPSAKAIVKLTTGCVALRSGMFEPVPTTNKLLSYYFGHKHTHIRAKTQSQGTLCVYTQTNKLLSGRSQGLVHATKTLFEGKNRIFF